VALATKQRKRWACPRCGHFNEPAHRNCRGERDGEPCDGKRRKKRRAAHSEVLRGDTYPLFVQANEQIHGVTDESCGVCGKPRSQERKHDRDHVHRGPHDGKPRGLACPGNQGCNVLMLPWITAATARGIWIAKRNGGEPDAERWRMIADYLGRVDDFYTQ
jgi:hypothetical protein